MVDEKQLLLQQLRSTDETARELATERLWQLWFGAAGPEAEQRLIYGEQLFEQKQWQKAEAALSALIQDRPDFAEAWNRRATLRYLQNRYRASLDDCRETVRLEPEHFGAWHGMALCLVAIRDYAQAARAARRALEIQPFTESNQNLLADCLAKLN